MSRLPSSDGGPISAIPLPDPFKQDITTIRIMIADSDPDSISVIPVIRFDGVGWRAWVRLLDCDSVYGVSHFASISEDTARQSPRVTIRDRWRERYIVEFEGDRKDLETAAKWLENNKATVPDAYKKHVETKLAREVKGFLGRFLP